MVLQEKIGVRSVRIALSVLTGTVLIAGQAFADEAIQKVEITGSSIKRIAVEGALPVQRLSQEQIAKTGATTVADLIQSLPAMQGFSIAATAAGSNSGGIVSASIHNIGESYTLVLLDGRRIAPTGSGSTINLNSIPMSAVERVEILTDGASALYGSDAIAGVINFILKKNAQGGTVDATWSQPTSGRPGQSYNTSLTYGFGDLQEDRFNILATYRHDEQSPVKATDRSFASTSYIPFNYNGHNYIYDRTSPAAAPANVGVTFNKGLAPIGFSPYLAQNGSCPKQTYVSLNNTADTRNCSFDSTPAVEISPQNKRDSFFSKAQYKASDDITVFAEMALSRLDLTARIAQNIAPFTIAPGSDRYNTYVLPYLTAEQAANVKQVSGSYRTYDWGTRDSQTVTDAQHLVIGADGEIGAWSFGTGLTWSRNKLDERYVGGYALTKEFKDMLATNAFNPFAPIGNQSDATKAQIANSIFHGSIREASTTLKGVDAHGSREVFTLPGGAANLGIGADYREYAYQQTPSAAAASGMVYNLSSPAAYDMKRASYGVFGELLAPVTKELEVTLAGRYDSIDGVDNLLAHRKMGETQSASTYKVSARWQPAKTLLFRGSYGTGFKAPSMLDIGQPLVSAGVTANSYACPFPGTDMCRPGNVQYNVLSGGNEQLKPERSKQYSIGFRVEPSPSFSFGADLWDVKITDAVSSISEQQIFANPAKFRDLFSTFTEPSTGNTYWAMKRLSINIGKTHNQGIDYDLVGRQKFSFGQLTANLNGTYLMKSDYTRPGTDGDWTSDLNFFGVDNSVAFRHIVRAALTLDTGKLSNTLSANYRNGYRDAQATVRNVDSGKDESIRLWVPSYLTIDWQGKLALTKTASIRMGVKNLLDREPPLSLRASSGHQVGFDPRYTDQIGRTVYLTGTLAF
ncbi:TonB-dependent receptor [Duganella sp. BJB488]|uniref:TonB-dependent receptor n=1 Tax=unclassified Duganella TaxID=2636909 RepID=UPI000E357B13|nr:MULTISPECIES: TonB-dependent receptor [unclassified Duganella]RFP11703.1 TonB-dependent receptor [Duganella sp. BJB489]RFP15584.1 TonB-dependent receptor [Duganella sp. BJB488]RFP30531.1 TonB-dependent receptor [Duganella sp. BJB480]